MSSVPNRTDRAAIASQTLAIVDAGHYLNAHGGRIELAQTIRACVDATVLLQTHELQTRLQRTLAEPCRFHTRIELRNQTTLEGLDWLLAQSSAPVAVLNFASAKNPGGGFLGGSQAQEESLARSSALYASQQATPEFYQHHRALGSLLYSDWMIWSPHCPVFRNDAGSLLDNPRLASFITAAAPNAGAIQSNEPAALPQIPGCLRQRAELVLALAASEGYSRLLLGAWGCGVFRNDPVMVAGVFAALLGSPQWSGRFERVLFSVLDHSAAQTTFAAFRAAFADWSENDVVQ